MSGFLERVVEDWLTKADERSYQLPFASYLARSGHKVKYVSSHGALEHGKDIVSVSRDRRLHAYQLKAGNVNLNAWRNMEGEVREAATVPVEIPGMARRVPNRVFLVLSGRITDSVRNQIALINDDHETRGYAPIETIELPELVGDFTRVFESFFPAAIEPLHDLVRLYLRDGRGPQDKQTLFSVLEDVIGNPSGPIVAARSLSNLVVAAEFAAAPYRRSGNHISIIDTWAIAACHVLRLARLFSLRPIYWKQSLEFCRQAIESAGAHLLEEAFNREHFLEGEPLLDGAFAVHRRSIVFGYIGAIINSRCIRGTEARDDSAQLLKLLQREIPLGIWGEGAWNYHLNLALALRHTPEGDSASEVLIASWLGHVCPPKPPWPRDPYWALDDELSLSRQREESAHQQAERSRISYTAAGAVGFLTRRLLKNTLKPLWPNVSRYQLAQLVPAEPWRELDWAIAEGCLELQVLPATGSWSQLRTQAAAQRSCLLGEEEAWLLPYFLCTYAHRVTAALSGELDFRTSPEAFRKEWTH